MAQHRIAAKNGGRRMEHRSGQTAADPQDVLTRASEWWMQMTRPFSPALTTGGASDQLMELVDKSFDSWAQVLEIQREFIKAFLGTVSDPEKQAR
jgi:hypothetical protein